MGFLNSIFFFFIFLSIFFFYPFVAAENQLNPGDELNSMNSTSNLVSNNGQFTLGFFTIPSTNFTYLGIWSTNSPTDMQVWVANRDIPMIGNGVLTIDDSGTLKVINGSGSTLFTIFNNNNQVVGSTGNKTTRAVLQDSGDFLVYDSTDKNRTLWQSFDYPTATLVPGMKLGYNLTTKQNWTLNSWLSDQIPATGVFTMRLEQYQDSPQLLIYRHGEIYWASGPWEKDNGTFQLFIDPSTLNFQTNFSLISDASGMYLTSSGLQLNYKGEIIGSTNFILTPQFCYGYQSDDGCTVSAVLPNCRAQIDSFVLKSGGWTDGSINYDDNSSISLNDCMERCWKDCSCLGFATSSNDTGCITWSGGKLFQVDESGQAVRQYVLVSQKPHKNRTWLWILVSSAIVLTFALTCCLCYVRIRRRRLKAQERGREMTTYIN